MRVHGPGVALTAMICLTPGCLPSLHCTGVPRFLIITPCTGICACAWVLSCDASHPTRLAQTRIIQDRNQQASTPQQCRQSPLLKRKPCSQTNTSQRSYARGHARTLQQTERQPLDHILASTASLSPRTLLCRAAGSWQAQPSLLPLVTTAAASAAG